MSTARNARLQAMASEAIDQYNAEVAGGGEPQFPQWARDVLDMLDELSKAQMGRAQAAQAAMTAAARDVLAERRRQVEQEGWTPERDNAYDAGELSLAAACYALAGDGPHATVPEDWPWDYGWWKPSSDRRNLVKAGALILADIERIDRAALCTSTTAGEGGAA